MLYLHNLCFYAFSISQIPRILWQIPSKIFTLATMLRKKHTRGSCCKKVILFRIFSCSLSCVVGDWLEEKKIEIFRRFPQRCSLQRFCIEIWISAFTFCWCTLQIAYRICFIDFSTRSNMALCALTPLWAFSFSVLKARSSLTNWYEGWKFCWGKHESAWKCERESFQRRGRSGRRSPQLEGQLCCSTTWS
jgi:hypothetical protein